MNIYKVMPDLSNKRQMKLWHKGLRSQWSAVDMRWDLPLKMSKRSMRESLGKVLTPVLMGEQSALYSVSSQIPALGHRSEVPAQLYLTTWAVDEARHTELFAMYFNRLDEEPLSIRKFPEGYLFQSKVTAKDTASWLAGVLASEVLAKLLMQELVRIDVDPVLSEIAHGILEDEARHLAFNHLYLEQRFTEVFSQSAADGEELSEWLRERLAGVVDYVPVMMEALDEPLRELGIDRRHLYDRLRTETLGRLEKSIERGARVGSGERAVPSGASSTVG